MLNIPIKYAKIFKKLRIFMWHKTDLVYLYKDNGYFPTLVYFPTLSLTTLFFECFQKLLYFIYFGIFCIILKIIKIFQKLMKKYTNNNF